MTFVRIAGLTLGCMALASTADAEVLDFENDRAGDAPVDFTIAQTGPGAAPQWRVEEHTSAASGKQVLVQRSADKTSARFPLAIYDKASFVDGAISVRFKTLSGEVDQAAGIVWRYRNPNDYYIVRANALEGNIVLYKVERGKRSDLKPTDSGLFAYGRKAPVESGAWQELRVEAKGDLFQVSLDGAHLFDVRDSTFAGPGKVGLWTKADSVTSFDRLEFVVLDGNREGR